MWPALVLPAAACCGRVCVRLLAARCAQGRGPYLAWVNPDEGRSVCDAARDRFCDSADTDVEPAAFHALMAEAAAAVRRERGGAPAAPRGEL